MKFLDTPDIMTLIAQTPWREAVTYRYTWPHEYVMVNRDGQRDLLAAFCTRIERGEGVECWFFGQRREYSFSASTSTGRFFQPGIHTGVGYAVSLESGNSAWVTLHIQTGDNELNKMIFDELQTDRKDIECRIDAGPQPDWRWHRYDRYTFSSINVRTDGAIDDPPEKQDEIRAWMLNLLPKFKEVFDPRVEDILNR